MKFTKKLLVSTLTFTSLLALSACSGTDSDVPSVENTYQVSFNTGTYGSSVATQSIKEGSKVTKPANPTHSEGNDFVEWQYENSPYDFSAEVKKDMELLAVWGNSSFTVTFETGYESSGVTVSSQSVVDGLTATKPDASSLPYRTGYEITGWTLNDNDYDFSQAVTQAITLKAVWESVNTYTVTLDTSSIKENVASSLTTQQVNEGRSVVLPGGSLTSLDNENDILNGWMMYDSTNKTVLDFDTSSIVEENLTLIPSWRKSFNEINWTYRNNLEDTVSTDWKTDATYSTHTTNPFGTDSNDLALQITRNTGGTTSNSINKFTTSSRVSGNQSLISFDIRAEDATNTALTIKIYGNNSTSSNAEVARLKINGTSATAGGANVQWGVYNSGGWIDGAWDATNSPFSFTNTSLNTDYRIQDDQWYTVQVLFEYVEINGVLELCGKVYLNGIHLSSSTLETDGYLTAVPAEKAIFENGASVNCITGINFSPDKLSGDYTGKTVYINNLYVEYK